MHKDIFEKILRLFDKLRVQADVARAVIAATPFCLNALQEIVGNFDLEFTFPFIDEWRQPSRIRRAYHLTKVRSARKILRRKGNHEVHEENHEAHEAIKG